MLAEYIYQNDEIEGGHYSRRRKCDQPEPTNHGDLSENESLKTDPENWAKHDNIALGAKRLPAARIQSTRPRDAHVAVGDTPSYRTSRRDYNRERIGE